MNPRFRYRDDNRFGGPLIPFVLGGIAGSIWSNSNNKYYYPYPVYPVYQYPVYYPRPYNNFYY